MNVFEKIGKKFGLIDENKKSKTEEIMDERNNIKLNLAVKLYQNGASDDEIEEVLSIIQSAEDDINTIKQSLIGTNINPDMNNPMKPLNDGQEAIKKRRLEMQIELEEAIKRILSGK